LLNRWLMQSRQSSKKRSFPRHVDRLVYVLAPAMAHWCLRWSFGPSSQSANGTCCGRCADRFSVDSDAIAGLESYGIILAGWSSNNNYSLLGALRSSAQMISYELPLGLFLVSVLILAGSFSLVELVSQQRLWWEWPWLWLMFPFFFICILAETNRSPFDLPETENELVAGYQTEYGGIKFALFFMAEYINMITTSAIMATLFFGGWRLPFGLFEDVVWLGPFVLAGQSDYPALPVHLGACQHRSPRAMTN
jgi:NADH-quinone oxidoreductase subunit H